MAIDLSARTCESCANSSVCPHREVFMKFFENRDKLLIRCGTGNGSDVVDTSQEVTVRVEHRYLNGPGLEEVYRNLGLAGSGGHPCYSWGGCCPMIHHHPFDSPIYAPHPHPAGYIEPLCRGARDEKGNRLPFIAPLAACRTNEVHAAPYPTYPGLNWWSCKSCASAGSCNLLNGTDEDYAKLGGSIYSTFDISYPSAKVGSDLYLADIETPKSIMGNYRRADKNPEFFHVTSEEDVFVIYYEYYVEIPTVEPSQWDTMDEIREKGLTHDIEIFYKDLSYVYPSPDGTGNPAMNVYLEGVTVGPVNRCNVDGKVEVVTGEIIGVDYNEHISSALATKKGEMLNTTETELIGAYAGKIITFVDGGTGIRNLNISNGNYRKLNMVEGDIVTFGFYMPAAYHLDLDMMRMMNYGANLDLKVEVNCMDDQTRYMRIALTVPKDDVVLQLCLVRTDLYNDPATYEPIKYLNTWDNTQIAWNMVKTKVVNDDITDWAYRPIAPRKWCAGYFNDRTPAYREDCPPSSAYLVRPFFDLIGYTTEGKKRFRFDPSTPITPAFVNTYPDELRFLATREITAKATWAMWTLRHDMIDSHMMDQFDLSDIAFIKKEPAEGEFRTTVTTSIDSADASLEDHTLHQIDMVHYLSLNMKYTPNNAKTIFEAIKEMDLPDNFQFALYALPDELKHLVLHSNTDLESVQDHAPIGVVEYGVSSIQTLANFRVTDENINTFGPNLGCVYILAVYPKNVAGISRYCQNFVAYQINVIQTPIETTATFIMNGEDLTLNGPDPVMAFEDMKAYTLSNIYPEDADKVYLKREDNIISLDGERAPYYTLSNKCNVAYQQSIKVDCMYSDNRCEVETSNYAIGYKGAYKIDFAAPDGDCIYEIKMSSGSEDAKTLLSVVDGSTTLIGAEFANGTSAAVTGADIPAMSGVTDPSKACTIHLWDVAEDCVITVLFKHGDNGTESGCSRCKGYVDASKYPYIEWVPICNFYK